MNNPEPGQIVSQVAVIAVMDAERLGLLREELMPILGDGLIGQAAADWA